jgi:hypothetical protein
MAASLTELADLLESEVYRLRTAASYDTFKDRFNAVLRTEAKRELEVLGEPRDGEQDLAFIKAAAEGKVEVVEMDGMERYARHRSLEWHYERNMVLAHGEDRFNLSYRLAEHTPSEDWAFHEWTPGHAETEAFLNQFGLTAELLEETINGITPNDFYQRPSTLASDRFSAIEAVLSAQIEDNARAEMQERSRQDHSPSP